MKEKRAEGVRLRSENDNDSKEADFNVKKPKY